jgi:hypothetical protein
VFGFYAEFTAQQGNPNIPARTGILGLKRQRSSDDDSNIKARLFEATVETPHRVILINGVDQLDHISEMCIKNAIVGGTMC